MPLQIDVDNMVQYIHNTSDAARTATNPGINAGACPPQLRMFVSLGDIVAINGQPAPGTMMGVRR